MTKFLVETKDNLQVVGNGDEMHARYNRPSVVRKCAFIEQHVALGTVSILTQLTDDASDAEFAELYAEAVKDLDGDAKAEAQDAVTEEYGATYAEGSKKRERAPAPAPAPASDKK